MAGHGNCDKEDSAEYQVDGRQKSIHEAGALLEDEGIEREEQCQTNDCFSHNHIRSETPIRPQIYEQVWRQGCSPVTTRCRERLPDQHTDIGEQEYKQSQGRKTPLEALLYLLVNRFERVIFVVR